MITEAANELRINLRFKVAQARLGPQRTALMPRNFMRSQRLLRYLKELLRFKQSTSDLDQFDIKNQSAGRRPAARIFTIGELGRDPEAALFALHHELHALGPTGNHLRETKRGGLTPHDRAVKELAVGGPTAVVDSDKR